MTDTELDALEREAYLRGDASTVALVDLIDATREEVKEAETKADDWCESAWDIAKPVLAWLEEYAPEGDLPDMCAKFLKAVRDASIIGDLEYRDLLYRTLGAKRANELLARPN